MMNPSMLSYKKPHSHQSDESSRASDTSPSPQIIEAIPDATRKVSSRRKALQEFYHLQAKPPSPANNDHQETETNVNDGINSRKASLSNDLDFDDAEVWKNYIKTTPIQDILKLRNKINSNVTSHDSEKKSIIYDNYYELIKLNDTLKNISSPVKSTNILENFTNNQHQEKLDQQSILHRLHDLKDFVETKHKLFNNDFPTVLEELRKNYDGADMDSNASINGIMESDNQLMLPDAVDKHGLIREVNLLLHGPSSSEAKGKLIPKIEMLLQTLDADKHPLLIRQLTTIKDSL